MKLESKSYKLRIEEQAHNSIGCLKYIFLVKTNTLLFMRIWKTINHEIDKVAKGDQYAYQHIYALTRNSGM